MNATTTLIVVLLNGEAVATCTDEADLAECLRIPRRNPANVITLVRRPADVAVAMVAADTAAFTARLDAERRAHNEVANEARAWGSHAPLVAHYGRLARMFPALY